MSNFPLYDNLMSKTEDKDLTIKQKEEFIKLAKNIDTEGSERIYILIRLFAINHIEDKTSYNLPYDGKKIKNDIKFDFNELPKRLKQILYSFIIMHCKTMEEESKIKKKRELV